MIPVAFLPSALSVFSPHDLYCHSAPSLFCIVIQFKHIMYIRNSMLWPLLWF